jgi:hypothetical protein
MNQMRRTQNCTPKENSSVSSGGTESECNSRLQ